MPSSFFTTLFVGAGTEGDPSFGEVLLQTVVGPLAAFFTFIGSMGNIPLASILYTNGVSFAGVMAFIFMFWLSRKNNDGHNGEHSHDHSEEQSWSDRLLTGLACLSFVWLGGGLIVSLMA